MTAGRGERGLTLVDLMISMLIMAAFLAGVFAALGSSLGAARVVSKRSQLDGRAVRVLERLAADLRDAGSATLVPGVSPAGVFSTQLEFQRPTGFSDGSPEWSGTFQIELRRDANDPDDGIDNDGDGLVDEGFVVRVLDAGTADEREEVIVRDVAEFQLGEIENGIDDNGNGLIDEPGFVVENQGEGWVLRLSVQVRGAGGVVLTRAVGTTVMPRN